MSYGKPFNPYKTFTGSWLPNWLLERTEINSSCKIVYARLCQHSGRDGRCIVGVDTIAGEIGLSKSMVEKCIAELKSLKLLASNQPGLNKCNQYFFLTHEWMTGAKQWKQEPQYSEDLEPHYITVPEPHYSEDIRDVSKEMSLRERDRTRNTRPGASPAVKEVRVKKDPTLQAIEKWQNDAVAPVTSLTELAGID